jgi:hypothetical protein
VKIEAKGYKKDGIRILTADCPNGKDCKVGSMNCCRCPSYQKRDGNIVYCRAKKGKTNE